MELVIRFDPASGKFDVQGPLENKVVCLGLLEFAKAQVLAHKPASQGGVLQARGGLHGLPGLRPKL